MQKNILIFLVGGLLFLLFTNYESDQQEKQEKLKKAKQELQKALAEEEAVLELYSNPAMRLVRDGTIQGYEKTTIAKAFNASFDKPKWELVKGKKGETLVQFTGKISKSMHDFLVNKVSENFSFEGLESDKIYEGSRRVIIDRLLKILGGEDNWRESDYVKNLNKKYGYSFKKNDSDNGYELVCENGKGNLQYFLELFDDCKALLWKIGEPVKVQWLVYPNGYKFELHAYETDAKGIAGKIFLDTHERVYSTIYYLGATDRFKELLIAVYN